MAFSTLDHEAVLAACAGGDHTALQQLYDLEAPLMLALCNTLLAHRDDAEEVVRDTFVLIWKNASNYDPGTGSARAWIYSILRYRAVNRLRQNPSPLPGEERHDDFPADVTRFASGPRTTPLTRTLAELSEAERRPVLLAFFKGLNYEQMAPLLAVPVPEIESRVRSALAAIVERDPT